MGEPIEIKEVNSIALKKQNQQRGIMVNGRSLMEIMKEKSLNDAKKRPVVKKTTPGRQKKDGKTTPSSSGGGGSRH